MSQPRSSFVFGCVGWVAVTLLMPTPAQADEAADATISAPARPAPLPPIVPVALPVSRHVDVGVGVALVQRVAEGQTDADPSLARYPGAIGWSLSARVSIMRYLRASFYSAHASGTFDMPNGTLGLPGDPASATVTSYAFGLRLSPTLPLGPRARTWLSVGAGWGRLEVGRFHVQSSPGQYGDSIHVRERAFSFVELPVGIGTSIDVIENWLAIEFEATAAFHVAQRGTARENSQAIDTNGARIAVGPFPPIAVSFVQTLGLALIL